MRRFGGIFLRAALCFVMSAVVLPLSYALALDEDSQALPTPTPIPEIFISPMGEDAYINEESASSGETDIQEGITPKNAQTVKAPAAAEAEPHKAENSAGDIYEHDEPPVYEDSDEEPDLNETVNSASPADEAENAEAPASDDVSEELSAPEGEETEAPADKDENAEAPASDDASEELSAPEGEETEAAADKDENAEAPASDDASEEPSAPEGEETEAPADEDENAEAPVPQTDETDASSDEAGNAAASASNDNKAQSGNPSAADAEAVCLKASCPHVGLDDDGKPIALCALGEQMLKDGERADNEQGNAETGNLPVVIHLRDGENTIFEDGVYVLSGGGEHARLNVARGLDVEISLNGAELLNLGLREDVAATLCFVGQNSIYTIAAPGATLTLDGIGCLNGVRNINSKELNVLGGNVALPVYAHSANGRTPYVFDAEGATEATVNGQPFPFTCPQDGGLAYLWLPTLDDGEYTAAVIDGVLTITCE